MKWIDHIRNNKISRNLLKIILIAWTIWNQRNNVIFRNQNCRPAYILESAMRTFRFTTQYNSIINNFIHVINTDHPKGTGIEAK